jgi:hypothetical protein
MSAVEAASAVGLEMLLSRRSAQKDMGPACGVGGGAHCAAVIAGTVVRRLRPPYWRTGARCGWVQWDGRGQKHGLARYKRQGDQPTAVAIEVTVAAAEAEDSDAGMAAESCRVGLMSCGCATGCASRSSAVVLAVEFG